MSVTPGRWIVVALLLCVAVSGIRPAAAALAPAPPLSIYPLGEHDHPWFDVTIGAGDSRTLGVGIRSAGDTAVTVATYATIATNPPNGGFAAGTADDEPAGAARWIDYPAATIDLQPGEVRELDFTVAVPAETPPGEYVAALVVQTTEPAAIAGTDAFRQIVRSAVSVEITVPGEMTAGFALGEPVVAPLGAQWLLEVPIANTGTARVRPRGDLVVTAPDGEAISTTRIEMGSVYGGNVTSVRVALPGQIPLGEYRVALHLTDEATGASDAIADAPITLAVAEVEEAPVFGIEAASVTPNADPVQYAEVEATIANAGPAIPAATVTLAVRRDGDEVERYPLAEGKVLPPGSVAFSQRYIPVDGWKPGTYTFQLTIAAVGGSTETILATVDLDDTIVVP